MRRAVARLVSGSIVAQAITLATMPVVTRLFGAEQLGAISVFISSLSVPLAVATLRLDSPLLIVRERRDLSRLEAVNVWATVVVAGLTSVAYAILVKLRLFGIHILPWWAVFAVPPIVIAGGFALVFRASRLRREDYQSISTVATVRNLSNVIPRLVGGALGSGITALLLAEVISAWASTYKLADSRIRELVANASRSRLSEVLVTVAQWKRFPVFEVPSQVFDQIGAILPVFTIAGRLGAEPAGLYAIAYRVTTLPSTHLGSALAEVFRGRFAYLVRAGDAKAGRLFFGKMLATLVACSCALYVPLSVVAPPIFGRLFGQQWGAAGHLVPALSIWAASSLVVSPLSTAVGILQRPQLKWIYDLSSVAGAVVAAYVTRGQGIQHTVVAFSIAAAASNIVYSGVLYSAVREL
ncbi:MAG: oligosaccharide flippase family protein [Deltaproteobacteria bacterium]|nr:oligosaccharide flippase family protein [Deltaproteobacteria bacterium]